MPIPWFEHAFHCLFLFDVWFYVPVNNYGHVEMFEHGFRLMDNNFKRLTTK